MARITFSQQFLRVAALILVAVLWPAGASGFSFWEPYAGRDGRHSMYGLAPNNNCMWYDSGLEWGKPFEFTYAIIFPAGDPRFTDAEKSAWNTAIYEGASLWTQYVNVTLSATPATPADAKLLFAFAALGSTAVDDTQIQAPHLFSPNHRVLQAPIMFDLDNGAACYWPADPAKPADVQKATQERIFAAFHEVGHALGLDDLYLNYTEEFVDHSPNGAPVPNREPAARADNVMTGEQLAPQKRVDNDEIAGLTWLWGAKTGTEHHQIVSGWLSGFNAAGAMTVIEHHGHLTGGTWTYLGSMETWDIGRPYVDLCFPGFESLVDATAWSADGTVLTAANKTITAVKRDGDWVRVIFEKSGWQGNFRLSLKSKYTEETRIEVVVHGGDQDTFDLWPSSPGLTRSGGSHWARPFGPVPEPSSGIAFCTGLVAFAALIRRRRVA